jgi:hypothetical protein
MKSVAIGIAMALFGVSAAFAQASYTTDGGNVCLKMNWIDHTRAPDDKTIVFYMKDNKAWVAHTRHQCPQLSFNGFAYVGTPPEDICGGLQAIQVVRSDAVCMIGPFAPYTPAPGPPAHDVDSSSVLH